MKSIWMAIMCLGYTVAAHSQAYPNCQSGSTLDFTMTANTTYTDNRNYSQNSITSSVGFYGQVCGGANCIGNNAPGPGSANIGWAHAFTISCSNGSHRISSVAKPNQCTDPNNNLLWYADLADPLYRQGTPPQMQQYDYNDWGDAINLMGVVAVNHFIGC